METVALPSYNDYMNKVHELIDNGELTVEQGIILRNCFKARLNERPLHVNYLMQCTGLGWKEINWTLNGLVLRGAIRRFEKKWYSV